MGLETETSQNPLGFGIYRNLVSGRVLIFRNSNPEPSPKPKTSFDYTKTSFMITLIKLDQNHLPRAIIG
jgi:hypothetical protein